MLREIENLLCEAETIPEKRDYNEQEDIDFNIRFAELRLIEEKKVYLDLSNLREVRQWFRIGFFGRDIENDAVFIVTHLDDYADFQSRALDKLKSLDSIGETQGPSVTMLSDHLVMKGGTSASRHLQTYGAIGVCVRTKRWLPSPVEDEANLDVRRSQLRLPPERDWIIEMSQSCP